MNNTRKCMVGHDDDGGWIFAIVIAIIVIAIVCMIVVYGGAFIGGFHSIKNYILAFKHNVFDSNHNLAEV
ncbi:MAG: hypothetical protein LUC38_03435 [Oscillospiraceae bacterium]|nr:hypothetical protein [Ruminococcus sp.]MCD8344995.1 hypothetical protein [Oscillospiraceae bacterium]